MRMRRNTRTDGTPGFEIFGADFLNPNESWKILDSRKPSIYCVCVCPMAEDDWEAIQFLGNDLLKALHDSLEGMDLFGSLTCAL